MEIPYDPLHVPHGKSGIRMARPLTRAEHGDKPGLAVPDRLERGEDAPVADWGRYGRLFSLEFPIQPGAKNRL